MGKRSDCNQKKSTKKQPKKSQHDLFKVAAKKAGCDEKFDLKKALKKLISPKEKK